MLRFALVCATALTMLGGKAALRVTATDSQKLALPGATCTAILAGAPKGESVVSDGDGVCTFINLQPGTYVVRVALDGFEPFARVHVVVPPASSETDEPVALTAMLSVAKLAQSVTVTASRSDASVQAGAAPAAATIDRAVLRRLPLATAAIDAALPLVPGVLRSSTGELTFNGASERQSALLVNGMNAVDPATGNFRVAIPIDSVEAVQVFMHPYSAEYGQFTGGVTRVDTRVGGDKWRFELNDFLPDLRFVNGRVHGIAEDSPHLSISGPLFGGRVRVSQSISYTLANTPVRGLEYPNNETRTQGLSAFSQADLAFFKRHTQSVTFGYAPERDDYVGLDVFRPKPTTPSRNQRSAWGTIRDRSQIFGGLLTSAISLREFDVDVFGQGGDELTITPTVQAGSYFARQNRDSARLEAFESFAFPTLHRFGTHDINIGADFNNSWSRLDFSANPVNVVRADGTLARRIEFQPAADIDADNREAVAFAQDRWGLRPNLTVDLGMRFEHQRIADPVLAVPRAGFAWSPWADNATVVRGGIGLFYDKVPLNIRSFEQYPARTITFYATDGVTVLDSRLYRNLLADAEAPRVVNNKAVDDEAAFVPMNLTWNVQVDHAFSKTAAVRVNLVSSETENVFIVQPVSHPSGTGTILLSSTGSSRYEALELTGRFGPVDRQLNASYTRSHSRGDLNDFNASFGDFAAPIIRANQYSLLPEDVPDRVLVWGSFGLPKRITVSPIFEARSGFPYSVRDGDQNYVGVRDSDANRFPWFVALDMEVAKEFRVNRNYGVRLSLKAFNVTNHFNPRDVRSNTADPQFGQFLASYRRYFAGGFDIVF
jgi:hypothetical protein